MAKTIETNSVECNIKTSLRMFLFKLRGLGESGDRSIVQNVPLMYNDLAVITLGNKQLSITCPHLRYKH